MTDRTGTDAPLAPGSTIGILGGGQLGRMLAVAAAQLGLHTHIFSDVSGPAFDVAPRQTQAEYGDEAALAAFAQQVDVVTYEFENVPLGAADYLNRLLPVRPGVRALEVAQDRLTEKTFLRDLGIAVAPFAAIDKAADLADALPQLGDASILKTRRLGYDGKGQVPLAPGADVREAFDAVGQAPSVLEQRLNFQCEISVLLARGTTGDIRFYDCPVNTHSGGILRRSEVPSQLPEATGQSARDIAAKIAEELGYIGVLAVELFYLGEDSAQPLIVNEIAPRVHNSGHWTMDACAISQFENHIRAVAGWPLGDTSRHSDAVMHNLIGEEANAWQSPAAEAGTCLHLYGKHAARPGRKMGHVTRLRPIGRP